MEWTLEVSISLTTVTVHTRLSEPLSYLPFTCSTHTIMPRSSKACKTIDALNIEAMIPHALCEPKWKYHTLDNARDLAELTDKRIISQQQQGKREASAAVDKNRKRKCGAYAVLKLEAWPA